MKTISYDTVLKGDKVTLLPFKTEHLEALASFASDERIWQYYVSPFDTLKKLETEFKRSLLLKEQGLQFPWVIKDNPTGKIIGSTRYLDINIAHHKLEIGATFIHPDHWSGPVNPECKLLMLNHCFETLGTQRVCLKTDALNQRSRSAILKTGAKFEGILRKDMLRDNGIWRDSAYHSILVEEWPVAKITLQNYLNSRLKQTQERI